MFELLKAIITPFIMAYINVKEKHSDTPLINCDAQIAMIDKEIEILQTEMDLMAKEYTIVTQNVIDPKINEKSNQIFEDMYEKDGL